MLLDLLADAVFVSLRSLFSWLGVRRRRGVDRLPPLSREAVERLAQDVWPGRRNARWN